MDTQGLAKLVEARRFLEGRDLASYHLTTRLMGRDSVLVVPAFLRCAQQLDALEAAVDELAAHIARDHPQDPEDAETIQLSLLVAAMSAPELLSRPELLRTLAGLVLVRSASELVRESAAGYRDWLKAQASGQP
jgi:hypothetical protein